MKSNAKFWIAIAIAGVALILTFIFPNWLFFAIAIISLVVAVIITVTSRKDKTKEPVDYKKKRREELARQREDSYARIRENKKKAKKE